MHVHTMKVSFKRSKQPASYESAEPAVEFTAALDEGEDAAAKSQELMAIACATTYAALGFTTPEKATNLLGSELFTGTVVEMTEIAESVANLTSAELKELSKIKAKEEKAAAKEAKKAGKTAPTKSDDDIPEESAKSDDDIPEDTAKLTAKPADDIPEEPAKDSDSASESDDDLSAEDLSSFVAAQVTDKKLTVQQVKDILAKYKVARLSDVVPGDRELLKKDLEELIGE